MKLSRTLEKYRFRTGPYASEPREDFGAFLVPGPCGRELRIIASSGDASIGINWEHVSVSLFKHCPNWQEMCFVKSLFWDDEETVMQLHPPKSKWINNHEFCLHLWRPTDCEIPLPPEITVGISGVTHSEMEGMSTEAIEVLKQQRLEASLKK
jgi:hypothetical protein